MKREEILHTVLERCIGDGLFVPDVEVDPNADLVGAGQIDSMGIIQLQSLIEELFGVVVPTALFVAELRTITRIVAYLEAEMRTGRAGLVAPNAE